MQISELANNVSASAVAAQTGVACFKTPFTAGRDVVANVDLYGVTGTPTIKIQGSPDNSTWTDIVTHTQLVGRRYNIKTQPYMRANVTAAGSAGTYSISLENGA